MTETVNSIFKAIQNAQKVVVTSHKSPDGDSIGSSFGLTRILAKLDKEVTICHPDRMPEFLSWVKKDEKYLTYEDQKNEVEQAIKEANVIFCLDYNSPHRVGDEMGSLILAASAQKIMIDHHLNPADFCDIAWSESHRCSTSEMVFELLAESNQLSLLDESIAAPIYLGIMTDTGSFRFDSVSPRTHAIAGLLMQSGLKPHTIHEAVFDTNTLDRLKLRGYATSEKLEIIENGQVALISLTEDELNRFNYQRGDTEGLVNVALSITGVKMAALFSEKDGKIKISFRGKGDQQVNTLASDHFQGGGHKYAAGGISDVTMEATLHLFKKVVHEYLV